MARFALCVLSLPLLTSCGIFGGAPFGGRELVQLYDMAQPDGLIEIEADRNGMIREIEADIPVGDLPAAIRDAAMTKMPGAVITGAERELKADGSGWEVKLSYQNRGWELVMDDMGNILETEKELRREEAPVDVLAAADSAVAGGSFKSVELIERGNEIEYHVKKTRDRASYKIVLDGKGNLIRAVREHRTEIEIPLN